MAYEGIAPIRFDSVSNVTATRGPKDPEVGSRCTDGGIDYVYVYNGGTDAQISVGRGAVLQSSASGYTVTVSSVTSADFVIGVCRNATLTTGTYGWLVAKGITKVQMKAGASATVAQRGLIEIAADGFFAPVSLTTANLAPACGVALEAITSGTSGSAFVSCYG
jgi:hypothetical protein